MKRLTPLLAALLLLATTSLGIAQAADSAPSCS